MHLRLKSSKRILTCLLSAVLAVVLGVSLAACSTVTIYEEDPDNPVGQIVPSKLAIVHTAGMAGSFEASDMSLGIASVAQITHDLEEQGFEVALLDSGDSLAKVDDIDLSDGEAPVAYLNAAGYDALLATTGELNLGRSMLAQRTSQADFSILSANLVDTQEEGFSFSPSQVIKLDDGRTVGIFGLTIPDAPVLLSPFDSYGLDATWDDLVACAQESATSLRSQGCKLVICLCDLGRTAQEEAFGSADLAQALTDVDVVLDVSEGSWSQAVATDASGEATLVVKTPEGLSGASVVTWERGALEASSVDAGSYDEQDEQVLALVSQTGLETEAQLEKKLSTSTFELSAEGSDTAESALGDLVADAVLWMAQSDGTSAADAAIVDPGSLAAGLPKGPITRADVLATCPHATTRLYSVTASGRQLQDALAGLLANPAGNYPQISGMTVTVSLDETKADTDKVHIQTIDDEKFSANARYTVILTEGALFGGTPLAQLAAEDYSNVTRMDASASKALGKYLTHTCQPMLPSTYQEAQGRVTLVKTLASNG